MSVRYKIGIFFQQPHISRNDHLYINFIDVLSDP